MKVISGLTSTLLVLLGKFTWGGDTPLFFLVDVMLIRKLMASLEAINGEATQEIEYMFFGLLEDFSTLEAADKVEEQEQWSIDSEAGTVRVRRTEVGGVASYVLTSKIKTEGKIGKEEVESETSSDMFDHFKQHGTSGMRKTRYCFNVPNSDLVWELDVFYKDDGEPVEWVKVDLEVAGEIKLPEWPVPFTKVITNQNGKRTPEEQEIVGDLFENHYTLKKTTSEPVPPTNFDIDAITKHIFRDVPV